MRREELIGLCLMLFCAVLSGTFGVLANQDRRTPVERAVPASADITGIARDLSDKAQDVWNTVQNRPNRTAFDLHMALGSFAGGTLAYAQMAGAGAEGRFLDAGARRLVAQAGEIDTLLGRGTWQALLDRWRLVQVQVSRLSDAYRLGYSPKAISGYRERDPGSRERRGFFRWKGRVDGSDWIMVRGDAVTVRHIANRTIRDSSFELPSPLPCEQLTVRLNKVRGRGKVEITQQPGLFNDCTVIVLLEDPQSGDDLYEFELTW